MFLSAVSVLVVAQSSSEIPEGLMNNPVYSIILTNSCNKRSRNLKALSIVHSNCLKISLKMALQIGPKNIAGIIIYCNTFVKPILITPVSFTPVSGENDNINIDTTMIKVFNNFTRLVPCFN